MFSNASGIVIQGGTLINHGPTNRTSRGMDLLMEWVATGAFHNSDELYDAPKCHPHTRVSVLEDIMQWVNTSGAGGDDFMLWFFGPAGAGKSAIAKRIAEIAVERELLIADFFFSRTSPTRGSKDRLVATLAYQLTVSIPETRSYIEEAIKRDPAIFHKNTLTQIDTLLIKPFQLCISSTDIVPSQKLIIIDGLDECNNNQDQVVILEAICRSFPQHNLPIKFLIVSRPEISLVTSFTSQDPLKYIHRRLALDDTYKPDDDICLFFSDKFEQIRLTHPLRSTIPISWPTQEMLETLIEKSSGQFIYASTVVKFVESICHRPTARLNIILGTSPRGRVNPFAELDALYNHILSSVDDIQITLRVLSLYIMTPRFALRFRYSSKSPELFLSLEPGDIQLSLINLSSIVTHHESSGRVEALHASLVDFLSDRHRSTTFYIDMASTCTDFVHRILQYVKGPDGIQAGDIDLFRGVIDLCPWILADQLRSDILNFDIDAFVNASTRWKYKEPIKYPYLIPYKIETFQLWKKFLTHAGLKGRDKKEALYRLQKYVISRLQTYQSHWQLKLLLTLAVTKDMYYGHYRVPSCRCVDILLKMDNHDLHLVDQDALDLRHAYLDPWLKLLGIISPYLDGDAYASAALHCMRFLSNPPEYSEKNECPKMGLIYAEWKATCAMTLRVLCKLLKQANTTSVLVQFIGDHDIHPAVQKKISADHVWEVDAHILAFLSRASVCSNWRIISAIKRSLTVVDQRSSKFEEKSASSDGHEEWRATSRLIRQRLDQCCWNIHHK